MKKFLRLLVCLSLCMTLSACGGNNRISGEVVEATPTALILEMINGKQWLSFWRSIPTFSA